MDRLTVSSTDINQWLITKEILLFFRAPHLEVTVWRKSPMLFIVVSQELQWKCFVKIKSVTPAHFCKEFLMAVMKTMVNYRNSSQRKDFFVFYSRQQ